MQVLGISFLESWKKFQSPVLTRKVGLDVGRRVFHALNSVEIVLGYILLLLVEVVTHQGYEIYIMGCTLTVLVGFFFFFFFWIVSNSLARCSCRLLGCNPAWMLEQSLFRVARRLLQVQFTFSTLFSSLSRWDVSLEYLLLCFRIFERFDCTFFFQENTKRQEVLRSW